MIAAIWCQSANGVIGKDGKIPWAYKGDLKRFKRITLGSTIVMGRKTWESIGRELPGRENVIVTSRPESLPASVRSIESVETLLYFGEHRPDVWFIGGAQVYAAAIPYCDTLDITLCPDVVLGDGLVMAPSVVAYAETFDPGEILQHEDEPVLKRCVFTRRTLPEAPYDLSDNRRLQEAGTLSRRPR